MVFAAAATASATTYTLTDLGILGGTTGNNSYAMGVNDSGVVAGASSTSGNARIVATIYSGGAWVNIGSGFYTGTAATIAGGINDNGQVAGFDAKDSFVYNIGTGTYTDIAAQPGAANGSSKVVLGADTYQTGVLEHDAPINGSGQSTGHYLDSSSNQDGFIWSGSSTINVPAPVGALTFMSGINNSGVAVGNYQAGLDPTPTGFYYSGGTAVSAINHMAYPEYIVGNEVVGADYAFANGQGWTYAAVYTLGAGSATYIGPTLVDSTAYGVSSSGTVVGFSGSDAFVYSGGAMTDLNTLVQGGLGTFSALNVAYGISPNGEYIVGDGTIAGTGVTHGFLLTAVATPEPSTLLLAVSGLMGLLAYAWRRRK